MNNTMRKLIGFIGLFAMILCGAGMLVAAKKPLPSAAPVNWNARVTRTDQGGYLLGNPAAPVKLVAYISYTCPHCAHFHMESDAELRIGMVGPGKGSLEVRPFLRNGVDLAVALLAECGPVNRFFGNHAAFLSSQPRWMGLLENLTDGQKARWSTPDFATRMRMVASDLQLYDIMEKRGLERSAADRCLADRTLADQLVQQTKTAVEKDDVRGTPSFVLDGTPLAGTYDWTSLKPQLEALLR